MKIYASRTENKDLLYYLEQGFWVKCIKYGKWVYIKFSNYDGDRIHYYSIDEHMIRSYISPYGFKIGTRELRTGYVSTINGFISDTRLYYPIEIYTDEELDQLLKNNAVE